MKRVQLGHVLGHVEDFCRSQVGSDVCVMFTADLRPGEGDSGFSPTDRHMYIGVPRQYLVFGTDVRTVMKVCVSVGHELRHFEQCGLAEALRPVSVDVCMSHMACRHNNTWYRLSGKKNHVCEVDAERSGYLYAFSILETEIGRNATVDLLLSYCNEHIRHPSEYYLCEEDCKTFPLRTMDDLSDAFDNAMERCRQSCHTYPVRDDTPFGDEFFDVMRRGRAMKEDCFDKFVHLNRKYMPVGLPTLRDGMACLSLYLHPEYADEYPADLSGLSAEAVFGSPFQETPERMLRYMEYVREHEVPVRNGGSTLAIPEPRRVAPVPSAGRESVSVPIGGDIGKNHDGPDGPG